MELVRSPISLILTVLAALVTGAVVAVFSLWAAGMLAIGAAATVFICARLSSPGTSVEKAAAKSAEIEPLLRFAVVSFLPLIGLRSLTNGWSLFILLGLCLLAVSQTRVKQGRQILDICIASITFLGILSICSWFVGYLDTGTLNVRNVAAYFTTGASVVALWLAFTGKQDQKLPQHIAVALLDSVAVYLIANVVMYFGLGITSPASELRSTPVGFVGLFGDTRVIYPLTNALSLPGVIAAGYIAAFPALMKTSGWSNQPILVRSARLFAVIAAVVVIVSTGSRVAALSSVCLGLLGLFWPVLTARSAGAILVVAMLVPFWWSLGQLAIQPLGDQLSEHSTFFGRRDRSDSYTLGNRTELWSDVMEDVQEQGPARLLFGSGANGQVPTGMIDREANLFDFLKRPEDASVHNSFLQQLVDQGVVGALALLAVVLVTTGALARRFLTATEDGHIGLAVLLFIATMGAAASTEEFWSSGTPADPFWILLLVALLARELSPATAKIRAPAPVVSSPVFTPATSSR